MNSEKKTEIKVGVTVFFALVILALIFAWAKNYSFNSNSTKLLVKFNTVAGLEVGDMVTVNGVKKGLVNSIRSDDNSALVEVLFNDNPNLKEDATFSIMMLDLMGGKKIEIKSGLSLNNLDFQKTQLGTFSGDISTAMATLNSVESDLIDVVKELKTSLEFVNSNFLQEEFNNNIKSSIANLSSLTGSLNELVLSNKENISNSIENTNLLLSKSNNLLDANSDNITSFFNNVNKTILNADSLINNIELLTSQTLNQQNNLGKILYDDVLLNDLKETLKLINELTKTLNKQLNEDGLNVKADVDLF